MSTPTVGAARRASPTLVIKERIVAFGQHGAWPVDVLHGRLVAHEDVVAIERDHLTVVQPDELDGATGALVERWTLQLQDWNEAHLLTVSGAELWAYGDGEVGLRLRHVEGTKVHYER